jgi:transposase
VTLPKRIEQLRKLGPAAAEALPVLARQVLADLHEHLRTLDERIAQYDQQLRVLARQSEPAQRLDEVLGIGPVTALSTVATIGNGAEFKNGRQFSAWMGLVPRQWSTGGKVRLGHITKAGDAYLRMLYVQSAKAALGAAHRRQDRLSRWALAVRARRGFGKAVVALAAKLARIAWALLSKGGRFRPEGLATA